MPATVDAMNPPERSDPPAAGHAGGRPGPRPPHRLPPMPGARVGGAPGAARPAGSRARGAARLDVAGPARAGAGVRRRRPPPSRGGRGVALRGARAELAGRQAVRTRPGRAAPAQSSSYCGASTAISPRTGRGCPRRPGRIDRGASATAWPTTPTS